jgi:hypothetical protein
MLARNAYPSKEPVRIAGLGGWLNSPSWQVLLLLETMAGWLLLLETMAGLLECCSSPVQLFGASAGSAQPASHFSPASPAIHSNGLSCYWWGPPIPLLFNTAIDNLAKIMIAQDQENRLITGLVPEYIENGVTILQYDDDTILCLKDDDEGARNMKLLLYLYEQISGLKINFEKSEVLTVSKDDQKMLAYSDMFNCAIGVWPINTWGCLYLVLGR